MKLRVVANDGNETTINCQSLLKIDGEVFDPSAQRPSESEVCARVTVLELAYASLVEDFRNIVHLLGVDVQQEASGEEPTTTAQNESEKPACPSSAV